jgi:DNA processing protein
MAGERMTSTEIWLRLMHTGSLYGDGMVEAARLQKQEISTRLRAGLTANRLNGCL